jgi:hypothetical protein
VIRFFLIALLSFILIRMIGQAISSFYEGINDNPSNRSERRKEGEVTIEKQGKVSKKISKSDGEYVDYEEIK